jgi:hypothetical protein
LAKRTERQAAQGLPRGERHRDPGILSQRHYRAVYTVQFGEVIYVLHAFQKRATRGIPTPKREVEAIRARLKQAEEIHQAMEGGGRR